jgi:hypothetical protein
MQRNLIQATKTALSGLWYRRAVHAGPLQSRARRLWAASSLRSASKTGLGVAPQASSNWCWATQESKYGLVVVAAKAFSTASFSTAPALNTASVLPEEQDPVASSPCRPGGAANQANGNNRHHDEDSPGGPSKDGKDRDIDEALRKGYDAIARPTRGDGDEVRVVVQTVKHDDGTVDMKQGALLLGARVGQVWLIPRACWSVAGSITGVAAWGRI